MSSSSQGPQSTDGDGAGGALVGEGGEEKEPVEGEEYVTEDLDTL